MKLYLPVAVAAALWAGCGGGAEPPDVEAALADVAFVQPDDTTGWRRVRALADSISYLVPPGYREGTDLPGFEMHGGRRWVKAGEPDLIETYGVSAADSCPGIIGVVYRDLGADGDGERRVSRETCRLITSRKTGHTVTVTYVADRHGPGPEGSRGEVYEARVAVDDLDPTFFTMTVTATGPEESVWGLLLAVAESVELDAEPGARGA